MNRDVCVSERGEGGPSGSPLSGRGARLLVFVGLLGMCACSTATPAVLPPYKQITIDRRLAEYPTGFELKPFMVNLNGPTAMAFDDDAGMLFVAEGGVDGSEPRIFGFGLDHPDRPFDIYPIGRTFSFLNSGFRIYGPIGGMVIDHGKIYVSHRDAEGMGVITAFSYSGSHATVVSNLPAQGDYSVTDLAVSPVNGRIYFGVGSATNSGVVGRDNWAEGWVREHPQFSDIPARRLKLLGYRFAAPNPLTGFFTGPDAADTAPYQPFGVSNITVIQGAAHDKPTGAIYSISPDGGDLKLEAWGVRYPRGLAVNGFGRVYFTDEGMELRGTRPIKDDPDVLFHLAPGAWYGWPDYSRSLQPISDEKYQPPAAMIMPSSYPDVSFVIDHFASSLTTPDKRWISAEFRPLAGAAKMDLAPATGAFRDFRGNLIVAMFGDCAPFATNSTPLGQNTGYRVVRVDPDSSEVADFIFNPSGQPKSRGVGALERPIDVKFGPDGALYILDFGELSIKDGRPGIRAGSGMIFKLQPAAASQSVELQ